MAFIIRPPSTVLSAGAQVPDRNILVPPPNLFTHKLLVSCPYYYSEPQPGQAPAGELAQGTRVLLARTENQTHWVIDARGLYLALPQATARLQRLE
jgi:hypothetical protein